MRELRIKEVLWTSFSLWNVLSKPHRRRKRGVALSNRAVGVEPPPLLDYPYCTDNQDCILAGEFP